eukprot:4928132-Prymnesium_polylepis.1
MKLPFLKHHFLCAAPLRSCPADAQVLPEGMDTAFRLRYKDGGQLSKKRRAPWGRGETVALMFGDKLIGDVYNVQDSGRLHTDHAAGRACGPLVLDSGRPFSRST